MKHLILIFAVIVIASCTKEVIKPVKEMVYITKDSVIIDKDTIYVPVHDTIYVNKEVLRVDTVKVTVQVTETDTVFVARIDTVYRIEYEEVIVHEHHYFDTLLVFPGHNTFYVPNELTPFLSAFYSDADKYGWQVTGGELVVAYASSNEFPGEGWNSYSYFFAQQWVIIVNGDLDTKYLFTPMYRELALEQLGRKYTRDNSIMDPLFDPTKLTLDTKELNKPYLDKLFAK